MIIDLFQDARKALRTRTTNVKKIQTIQIVCQILKVHLYDFSN